MNKIYGLFYICFILLASCQNENPIPQEPQTLKPLPITQSLLERSSSVIRELVPSKPVCIENDICWGNQFPSMRNQTLSGTSPSDIWTLAEDGQGLFHFDGTKWSLASHSFGIYGKLWTQTPNQIWILDDSSKTTTEPNGVLWQCQPSECQKLIKIPEGISDPSYWQILGTAPNRFWFYGLASNPPSTIYHFDGTKPDGMKWTAINFKEMAKTTFSIDVIFSGQLWGISDHDLWVPLYHINSIDKNIYDVTLVHYDGTKLDQKIDLPDSVRSPWETRITGTSSADIWLTYPTRITNTERDSVFYYYDGTNWQKKNKLPFSFTTKSGNTYPVSFRLQPSGDRIWMHAISEAMGYNQLWLWENQTWSLVTAGIYSVLFVTGFDNLWWTDKSHGTQTTHPKFSSQTNLYLEQLLFEGKDSLWFRSKTLDKLARYKNGEGFQRYQFSQHASFSALWENPNNPDELWIATADGQLQHFKDIKDINDLRTQTSYVVDSLRPSHHVTDFWGSQTHGLWALVSDGRILRFQDSDWIVDKKHVGKDFDMLHGTGTNTLWVGGENSLIRGTIQSTDVTWMDMNLPLPVTKSYQILKAWDMGENNVWFSVRVWEQNGVKSQGTLKLLHFDGQGLSWIEGPQQKVYSFAGDQKGNIWATVETAPFVINPPVIGLFHRVGGSWVQRASGGFSATELQVTNQFGLFQFNASFVSTFFNDGNWLWKPIP